MIGSWEKHIRRYWSPEAAEKYFRKYPPATKAETPEARQEDMEPKEPTVTSIKLNDSDVKWATEVGKRRQSEAERMNLPDKHGYDGDGYSIHIEGAGGELALARILKVRWSGSVNTFKLFPDLGDDIQVRTRSKHYYDLLIRKDDPNDHLFFLMTGNMPFYVARGFMKGGDAKREEWKKNYGDRPPAYFVPQAFLISVSTLRGEKVL